MALGIETSALKSWKTWAAVVVALIGVLTASGVILDGSTAAHVVGYVLTLLAAISGHGAPAATVAE